MERYLEVKGQNPGSLLLFRMGDFYELFYDDAQLAARVLGPDAHQPRQGFAQSGADGGLSLSRARELSSETDRRPGCASPSATRSRIRSWPSGLVRREVTRIVTPGTLVDEELLDPRRNNFLASLSPEKNGVGLAWLELSTGRFCRHARRAAAALADELARIQPAECLVPDQAIAGPDSGGACRAGGHAGFPPASLELTHGRSAGGCCWRISARRRFDGFDVDEQSPGVTAAGALLQYVQETQKSALAPHRAARSRIAAARIF